VQKYFAADQGGFLDVYNALPDDLVGKDAKNQRTKKIDVWTKAGRWGRPYKEARNEEYEKEVSRKDFVEKWCKDNAD